MRVIRAAAGGEPVGTFVLDVPGLLRSRALLEATVLASAVPRRSVPVEEQPVREVGRQLFDALFTGPVGGAYRASLGVAQQRGKRLRVVLRLTAPELAALPWEMLFDPETETYLCRREPLVRHVHAPYTEDPLEVRPPLRILGLVASPRGLQALDVDAEKSNLARALAEPVGKGLIELVWVAEATWQGVHARLLAEEWHVLHFIGHGDFDPGDDEGALALVGADGRADRVEASRLADLLAEAQPMPRLVVLNSCSSGKSGANDLFSGTAAALVRSGISAVAAMQFAISDAAAIAFARGFYTAIAHGRSIDEAARSGRIAILGTPRSLEWVTPVLYVRGQASQLFTLATPPAADRPAPRERQAFPDDRPSAAARAAEPAQRTQAQLRALYVAARAELRIGNFDNAIGMFDDLLTLEPRYLDAAELRDTARRGRQLTHAYAGARAAEDSGEWAEAVHGYGQVLQLDPDYQDAAGRQAACQTRQQIGDLQAELRYHADAGQWQAVLDTDAELARLDPDSADPDGFATAARANLAAEQRAADLAQRYARARAAEDSGEWAEAVHRYGQVLQLDPDYLGAAARQAACQMRQRAADLQAQLRGHARASHWQAVLDTDAELARLDPDSADPDGLATAARANLAAEQRAADHELESRYAQARAAEDQRNWAVAARWYSQVLQLNPEYRDATARQAACQARQRVVDLQAQLRGHARASHWQAVLDTDAELARLDPDSADPDRLATAARANLAAEYKARIRQQRLANLKPAQRIAASYVYALCWHPDGSRIAVGAVDKHARIFDLSGNAASKELEVKGGSTFGVVHAVAFSGDGTRLITGGKYVRIWDTANGQQLRQIRTGKEVRALVVSPDGTRLAASAEEGFGIWDIAGGNKLITFEGGLWGLAFSSDGTKLATGHNAKAHIRDATSGAILLTVKDDSSVRSAAFSPDGTWLATGSEGGTARIWDAANGQQLTQLRHDSIVRSVAFSPDGTWLATGSAGGTARIWDAADGQQLTELRHDSKVTSVAFSPDGTWLATGSDKYVQIWPLSLGVARHNSRSRRRHLTTDDRIT